ncbi:MAG: creatininase family protein [Pseudobdellovibrionaceae bacterium]
MEIYLQTWPEVENYLKHKKDLIFPVGSTEQHGPTGLIGTDYLTAWEVAKKVGEKTHTLVASPLCYGMALHHLAFPGSAALKPTTYIQVVKELVQSYARAGFEKFIFINGHGGNIPSLQASFSEILGELPRLRLELFNWWHLKEVTDYEKQVFGEMNGFHATCGEISATMASHPQAFQKTHAFDYFPTVKKTDWPLSPERFRETFPDGRMGSDPRLSTRAHGEEILARAVKSIAEHLLDAAERN